jgi:hypothetical protein
MRYAYIETATGRVENVIIWDGEAYFPVPEGYELIALGDVACGPEWIYINDSFQPPIE